MSRIISYVLIFALGLTGGMWLKNSTSATEDTSTSIKTEELSPSVLSQQEIDQVAQLEDADEKYRKANEVLAKVMQIFITDWGLRLAYKKDEDLVAKVSSSSDTPSTSANKCPPCQRFDTKASERKPIDSNPKEIVSRLARLEKNLTDIRNTSDQNDLLEKVKLDNLFDVFSYKSNLNPQSAALLTGTFIGRLSPLDSTTPPSEVELTLSSVKSKGNGEFNASIQILLSRGGKTYSNTSGEGDLKSHLTTLGQNSQVVLVELGGKGGYFQLYPTQNGNQLFGWHYKMTSFDKLTPAGKVSLFRK